MARSFDELTHEQPEATRSAGMVFHEDGPLLADLATLLLIITDHWPNYNIVQAKL